MGAISYLILKVGLISVQAGQAVDLGAMEVMWLVAFLAGFSDRFSDYLLKNVVGRFGGSTDGDLLTLEMSNKVTKNETNKYPFFNFFVSRKNGDNQTEGEIINPEKNTNGNSSKVNESSEIPGTENTVKTVSENTVKVVKTAEKDDK